MELETTVLLTYPGIEEHVMLSPMLLGGTAYPPPLLDTSVYPVTVFCQDPEA